MDKGIEILIVEDSPTQALQLKYILEQHRYRVSVASNGKEALVLLNEHIPHIVISDIIMPEMDGYELCQRIKEDDTLKDVAVILLTSLSDPRDVIRALECGADNFTTKPYHEQRLISCLEGILLNHNKRNASAEKWKWRSTLTVKNMLSLPIPLRSPTSSSLPMRMSSKKTASLNRLTGS